jgi:hypothetical protein
MKLFVIILGVLAAAIGLACNANANTITFVGMFSTANQNPVSVLAAANTAGIDSDSDLLFAARLGSAGTVTNSFGTFTVSLRNTPGGQLEFLTYSLNPGFVLAGIGIHGGSGQHDNFFSVNDATGARFDGPFHAPIAGKSGTFAGLSNFDIFVEGPEGTVPDVGTTGMLFGCALTGLAAMRRWLTR